MKKIDKLVLGSFAGPFALTFSVVLFIFLTQYLLRYLDDFLGKDLGFGVFAELIFYFSMNMVPNSLPLAILIASLMTFGNLGEHNEITAIKGSGISLVRIILPIFLVVTAIAIGLFYFNNIIVPKANLRAYSLLYDIRQKKPALDIKEGAFYNGLPGYSIKVTKKFPDGKSLKGVMIYNHTSGRGNTDVILADSGFMYTFNQERYLALELFNGKSYTEYISHGNTVYPARLVRNEFKKSKMVFSLASFDLKRTQQELFATNKYMKNIYQLDNDVDSMRAEYNNIRSSLPKNIMPFYSYQFSDYKLDTLNDDTLRKRLAHRISTLSHSTQGKSDHATEHHYKITALNRAVNQARSIKSFAAGNIDRLKGYQREGNGFEIELYRKYTQSAACLIMFLIGAPLGTIIRKGGLGIPIFIGIIFFILYYVVTMIGEKQAKESVVLVPYGMWVGNLILLPIGLFFLRQARKDARIFERDAWVAFFKKLRSILPFSKNLRKNLN